LSLSLLLFSIANCIFLLFATLRRIELYINTICSWWRHTESDRRDLQRMGRANEANGWFIETEWMWCMQLQISISEAWRHLSTVICCYCCRSMACHSHRHTVAVAQPTCSPGPLDPAETILL